MKRALCTGSFNPITYGHMNVIDKSLKLFDEVIIGILNNKNKKNTLFTPEERVELIKEIYKDIDRIKVVSFDGTATDLALNMQADFIVRGIRGLTDCDYEISMAYTNKRLSDNKIETVCLFPDAEYQFVSSTIVRELNEFGKDISDYVSPIVEKRMILKRRNDG